MGKKTKKNGDRYKPTKGKQKSPKDWIRALLYQLEKDRREKLS